MTDWQQTLRMSVDRVRTRVERARTGNIPLTVTSHDESIEIRLTADGRFESVTIAPGGLDDHDAKSLAADIMHTYRFARAEWARDQSRLVFDSGGD